MRTRSTLLPLWVLVFLLAGVGTTQAAYANSSESLWATATKAMADGKPELAVERLRKLWQEHPEAALADDALFLAGTLVEEKLGEPVRAADLYEQLTREYPESRSALAAQRRLVRLRRGLGPNSEGAKPLAAFQKILNEHANRDEETSLAAAQKILEEHPDWNGRHQVRMWMAETWRRLGDLEKASPYFAQIIADANAPSEAHIQARLGISDLRILMGEFSKASEELAVLRKENLTDSEQHALQELEDRLKLSKSRSRLVSLCYLALAAAVGVLLAIGWRSANTPRRFLANYRNPPIEVWYMLPFALLFTLMALTGHQEIGPAVAIISVGGLLIAWLTAAGLSSKTLPLSGRRAWLCATAATLATLSLCYLALHRSQLLDLLQTTLEFGPE